MKMKFTDTSRAVQQTTSANMLEMFLLIRTLYTADADVANKEETMLYGTTRVLALPLDNTCLGGSESPYADW